MTIDVEEIRWASGDENDPVNNLPNKVEPPTEFKTSGEKRNQPVARQWLNYQFSKYYEFFGNLQSQLEAFSITVRNLLSGGGDVMSTTKVNEVYDSNTYQIPLANSVEANSALEIEKTDLYKDESPEFEVMGSDLIEYSGGTDTSILMNNGTSEKITLISNGSNRWRL